MRYIFVSCLVVIAVTTVAACTPGQNGPLTLNATDSCVNIFVYGNPTGGTATTTAEIPVSAIPGTLRGVQGAVADTTVPSDNQTCTLSRRDDTQRSYPR